MMVAESRDAVFAELRRKGIKAIKVVAADGSKANGEIRGVRKRVVVALGAWCFVLGAVAFLFVRNPNGSPRLSELALESTMRRQVIGDAAIIDKGIREGWADVFTLEGDRFLASFAVPGTPPAIRSTTEEKVREALDHESSKHPNLPNIQTSIEARQILAMVAGMKQELREFIADGGTIKQYGRRLVQRQEAELGYYHRAKTELDRAIAEKRGEDAINTLVEKHNAALRKIGVRLLVLPE